MFNKLVALLNEIAEIFDKNCGQLLIIFYIFSVRTDLPSLINAMYICTQEYIANGEYRPESIKLQNLSIMLFSVSQFFTYYAHAVLCFPNINYADNFCR